MSAYQFVIFAHHYSPFLSGIASYTEAMVQFLSQKYSVVVITTNTNKLNFKSINKNITIYRLKSISLFFPNFRFPLPCSLSQLKQVHREVFTKKKNWIIINTRFYPLSLIGAWYGHLSQSPTLIVEHGSTHLKFSENKLINWIIAQYEHLITFILKLYKPKFAAVSTYSAKWLNHFDINTQMVIPYGLSFGSNQKRNDNQQKKIILYAGRIIAEKGIFELLFAFQKIQAKFSEIYLYYAGEGQDLGRLQKLVDKNSRIKCLGYLNQFELSKLMREAYLLIHPSKFVEAMPTVILQAGEANLPIISTISGGLKEIFRPNVNMLPLKTVSSEEIIKVLFFAIQNPEAISQYAVNFRELIEKKYRLEESMQKVIEFFRQSDE